MTIPFQTFARRAAGAALAAAVLAAAPAPAMAQDRAEETRIRKLEAEVRALQRKVFPGGDARFFEPEIQPGGNAAAPASPAATGTVPAATALTDVLARLDALEMQMQRLTERSEEQANALSDMDRRLTALEGGGAAATAPASAGPPSALPPVTAGANAATPVKPPASTATSDNLAAMTGSAPAGAPATPDAARLAAVQAIAKPLTDDPGDDEYSYGFRLWNAGFYPEARQQLSLFIEKYPKHRRISFGRNLLGRAYLDDGLTKEAAQWFLRNYNADKSGDRAPDSLLYLGITMIAMNDTKRACIALAEFGETYPAVATGRLAAEYQANRAKVRCS